MNNIQKITYPITKVTSLSGVTFTYDSSVPSLSGLSGMTIPPTQLDSLNLPDITTKDVSGNITGINLTNMIPILTEAVKTLNTEIDDRITTNNLIVGGDFTINPWQRGTSFTGVTSGTYTADRWKYVKSTSTFVHNILQSTDYPDPIYTDVLTQNSISIELTTAKASLSATDYVALNQTMCGYTIKPVARKSSTLSFWVKSSRIGTYCIALRNKGDDLSYVSEYSIDIADAWEKKVISIAPPTSGTWNYTNDIGLQLFFTLGCGSTYQTSTKDQWISGKYYGTTNQINGVASKTHTPEYFRLALIQLEPGDHASRFNQRPIALEELLCKRFYWRVGDSSRNIYYNWFSNKGTCYFPIVFPTNMRMSPSVSVKGMWGVANCGQPVVAFGFDNAVILSATSTANSSLASFYTIDATTYVEINAEF